MTGSDGLNDGPFQSNQSGDAEDPIKLKEDEKSSKLVRVLTVSMYIFSVSFIAICLSAYYLIFWKPTHVSKEHAALLMQDDDGGAIANKLCS